jgi:chemotaxis protein CheD
MTTASTTARRTSVGIGQIAVSKDTSEVLVAYGLGSCVGVSAYDPVAHICGLAHILLPESNNSASATREPAWYAAAGITNLLRELTALGAIPGRLVVKLAGGAAVLGEANASKFRIGERNAEVIIELLRQRNIRPCATSLGGSKGRTVELHVVSGKTFVRTAASPATEL